ncbi:TetR/AcrR family transcriptional regulator [Leifsonia sp. NPDC058292]|uniref:TetR/AcrR family transcriptional regulator n=1 Tax=Leifsonia sp. NPDC058292 TaxID=3346428 RepID=UPI0036D815CC
MDAGVQVASEPATPRRNARGIARREEILDAAGALFADVGFGGVSLRDIAARAGLSHPGLLRHFSSKDELLLALLDRYEVANEAWLEAVDAVGRLGGSGEDAKLVAGPQSLVRLAERNETLPGYVALFTALAGEATSVAHPAHPHFRERYARLRRLTTAQFETALAAGSLRRDVTPADEAVRLAAAWDGLQLQSLYEPELIAVPERLRAHLAWLAGSGERVLPDASAAAGGAAEAEAEAGAGGAVGVGELGPTTRSLIAAAAAAQPDADDTAGYAPGRARRIRIVDDAMSLFAAGGFTATSLQEVADKVGITKSTLLYHFRSKDELLLAVLDRRDQFSIAAIPRFAGTARERLDSLVDGARRNAEQPGLVELYSVLAGEATSPDHPGHAFFRARFQMMRSFLHETFADLEREGHLAAGSDPEREAVWFLALWDGLQFQWLYDRGAVDIAGQLRGHLDGIVVDPPEISGPGTASHPS